MQHKFAPKDGSNPMDVDIEIQSLDQFTMDNFEFVPDEEMHVDALYETDSDIEVDIGNKVYLDQITESIKLNDLCLVEELRCLYQQMATAGHTLCDYMLHHVAFLESVTGVALLHKDICISRFAVLILQQISKVKGGCRRLADTEIHSQQLFENINKLMCCHSRAFIKKQAIRFMDTLSVTPSWNFLEINISSNFLWNFLIIVLRNTHLAHRACVWLIDWMSIFCVLNLDFRLF